MADLTDRYTPVIDYWVEKLRQPNNLQALGIPEQNEKLIFYGDQNLIPATPSVAIIPGPYNRSLNGMAGPKGQTLNTIRVFFLCYIARIDSTEEILVDVNGFGEKLMDICHEDTKLGGLVIHGFVNAIEPGFATRSGTYMHACRVTWEGLTKTFIL